MFAAIVDVNGVVVAHSDRSQEGQPLPPGGDLAALVSRSPLSELVFIYSGQGRTLEYRQPLLLGDREFGSIRVGVSTLLIRRDLDRSLTPAIVTAFIALGVAVVIAMLLAQVLLRPIHVIRSGLTRLGRGEFGVRLDLDRDDEFGELGTFFNVVSDRLAADAKAPLDPAAREQAALNYARKLAALGRLSAGVAHEMKNPLNAMMIHLELLRQQIASPGGADADRAQAEQHVDVIASEIRRLDEVVQGFLKFSRPEELHLQPVNLAALIDEIVPIVEPEAERAGVRLVVDCDRAPDVNGGSGDAAAGVPQPRAERLPGDAGRRDAADRRRRRARPARVGVVHRHRRRHQAGASAADLRPVLHDQGEGQRHRPVDGVPNGSDARRRD